MLDPHKAIIGHFIFYTYIICPGDRTMFIKDTICFISSSNESLRGYLLALISAHY